MSCNNRCLINMQYTWISNNDMIFNNKIMYLVLGIIGPFRYGSITPTYMYELDDNG